MTAPTDAVRIAVEGCGHGTLDAIYTSVKKSCEIKGWDGVDLLIICGDFQAVRNHQDLNVTAMPAKYRKIGDFHQYYYGTKKAPYLTVFIGGNHEASNHLFELHYGGWAAPDIYYLGAANVITLGPITIAGTSGVYKKYDYRRPHFERLPYNGSEIRSIYHQRELDIRKLLSYRSQVDIGLSHDWPRGIEWLGDHQSLFARKKYLRAEAETGELGSLPSALVLDRLRPPYWFSAHHHYRYTAIKQHKNQKDIQQVTPVDAVNTKVATNSESSLSKNERSKKSCDPPTEGVLQPQEPTFTKVATISAWNAFKNRVAQQDAEDERRDEQALRQKIEEQERSGQPAYASYNFEENFKEVNISEANGAQRRSSQSPNKQVSKAMPQLDGTCCSLPLAKRRRKSSPSDVTQQSTRVRVDQVDGSGSEATVTNPDAIDIDMSDSDSEIDQLSLETQPDDGSEMRVNVLHKTRKDDYDMDINGDIIDSTDGSQPRQRVTSRTLPRMPLIQEAASRESLLATDSKSDTLTVDSDSTIYLPANGSVSNSTPTSAGDILGHRRDSGHAMSDDHMTQRVTVETNTAARLPEYSTVDSSMESAEGGVTLHTESGSEDESEAGDNVDYVDFDKKKSEQQSTADDKNDGTDIPDDVRAQLAEMSSTFAPEEKIVKSGHLPFPEDIGNKETRFLALGKVEEGEPNEFLQLLEIKRYDPTDVKEPPAVGPRNFAYELQYDPEWLAITRVFASELKLGGSQRDGVPPHRGETYYRERILEEEQWVDENITKKNLLKIPNNFVIQTEQQDWDALPYKEKSAMPRELTNPQTSQFCELLGIPNPFDISEGERDARMERGPASDDWQQRTANRGRGGNGGNRGGRGGWGGRGRGGGSGRGRGRGRGFN